MSWMEDEVGREVEATPVEESMTEKTGQLSPTEGGCWFCEGADGSMLFTVEWDANFHEECLRVKLAEEPKHPEAHFIAIEFLGELEELPVHARGDGCIL